MTKTFIPPNNFTFNPPAKNISMTMPKSDLNENLVMELSSNSNYGKNNLRLDVSNKSYKYFILLKFLIL